MIPDRATPTLRNLPANSFLAVGLFLFLVFHFGLHFLYPSRDTCAFTSNTLRYRCRGPYCEARSPGPNGCGGFDLTSAHRPTHGTSSSHRIPHGNPGGRGNTYYPLPRLQLRLCRPTLRRPRQPRRRQPPPHPPSHRSHPRPQPLLRRHQRSRRLRQRRLATRWASVFPTSP